MKFFFRLTPGKSRNPVFPEIIFSKTLETQLGRLKANENQ